MNIAKSTSDFYEESPHHARNYCLTACEQIFQWHNSENSLLLDEMMMSVLCSTNSWIFTVQLTEKIVHM